MVYLVQPEVIEAIIYLVEFANGSMVIKVAIYFTDFTDRILVVDLMMDLKVVFFSFIEGVFGIHITAEPFKLDQLLQDEEEDLALAMVASAKHIDLI